MPNYEKCPKEVHEMAFAILAAFETHTPLVNSKARIDLMFAFPFLDEGGFPLAPAIQVRGREAYGVARILGIKDRVMGRGDGEILLDGHWWENATEDQQKALLDHELHHFAPKLDRNKQLMTDSIGRPLLKMRKHDIEFGWFSVIAARHGANSQERIQAKAMMDGYGQLFWPQMVSEPKAQSVQSRKVARGITSMTIVTGDQSVTIDSKSAKKIVAACDKHLSAQSEQAA